MKIFDNLQAFIWRHPQANNCNSYLIRGSKKILIDPGHRHLFDHVRLGLYDLGLTPEQIDLVIITHGHPDHLEAAGLFKAPTLKTMSHKEWLFIQEYAGRYGWDGTNGPGPDFFLQEGELIIGDLEFQVLITPGHSPGSLCLYWPEHKALFTGDLIFSQGVGRTDLPGGDGALLKENILRMSDLDIEVLCSGHGEVVKGRKAVEANFEVIKNVWFNYL
jgi:glyoxylase-like metal-dependent hydrolase (beta-lactamase superfamily II)